MYRAKSSRLKYIVTIGHGRAFFEQVELDSELASSSTYPIPPPLEHMQVDSPTKLRLRPQSKLTDSPKFPNACFDAYDRYSTMALRADPAAHRTSIEVLASCPNRQRSCVYHHSPCPALRGEQGAWAFPGGPVGIAWASGNGFSFPNLYLFSFTSLL